MASQVVTMEDEVEVLAAEVQRSDEDLRRSKAEIQSLVEQNQLLRQQVKRLQINQSPVVFPNQSNSEEQPTVGREHESMETHAARMNGKVTLPFNTQGLESPMQECQLIQGPTRVEVANERTGAGEGEELAAQWPPSKTSTAGRQAEKGIRASFLRREDLDISDVLTSGKRLPDYQQHMNEVV